MADRLWRERLERLERIAVDPTLRNVPVDVVLSEIAAIRAEVTGIEIALDAYERRSP